MKLVIAAVPRKPARRATEIRLAWPLDFGNTDRQYPPRFAELG
jgi:hypothetical protein